MQGQNQQKENRVVDFLKAKAPVKSQRKTKRKQERTSEKKVTNTMKNFYFFLLPNTQQDVV